MYRWGWEWEGGRLQEQIMNLYVFQNIIFLKSNIIFSFTRFGPSKYVFLRRRFGKTIRGKASRATSVTKSIIIFLNHLNKPHQKHSNLESFNNMQNYEWICFNNLETLQTICISELIYSILYFSNLETLQNICISELIYSIFRVMKRFQ